MSGGVSPQAADRADRQGPDGRGVQGYLPKRKSLPPHLLTAVIATISSHHLINHTAHQLVDEQRKYFKTVKDFQDECNKNDWLVAKREQLLAKTSS